jgi:hypothetical protein
MKKLEAIFQFLKENRIYNKEVQTSFYKHIILPHENKEDKIIALLHHVVNTQSQPKIDKLAIFFKKLNSNKPYLNSYKNFINLFGKNRELSYNNLFTILIDEDGWGNKTAALFCKMIYHLHCGEYDTKFKIWDDIPNLIADNDKFYLPVDAVIIDIFSRLNLGNTKNFDGINNFLNKEYQRNDIEIWDDLWFWGFISQKSVKGKTERELGWNEAKYWALLETNKDDKTILEIKEKVKVFIKLLV